MTTLSYCANCGVKTSTLISWAGTSGRCIPCQINRMTEDDPRIALVWKALEELRERTLESCVIKAITQVAQDFKEGKMLIQRKHFITRQFMKESPHWLFLFGDNLKGYGRGGQAAEMRGEPNSHGIPTKRYPSLAEDSFFSDNEYANNTRVINIAFNKAEDRLRDGDYIGVVIPEDGLGTGLADLANRAPRTNKFLLERLALFEDRVTTRNFKEWSQLF